MFQVSNAKGRHFLDLLDDDIHPIEPSYTKGGSWIKYFRHLNFLCIQVTRAIVNYAHRRISSSFLSKQELQLFI